MIVLEKVGNYRGLGEELIAVVKCIQSAFDETMPLAEILPELKGDYVCILHGADKATVTGYCAMTYGLPSKLITNCPYDEVEGYYLSAAAVSKGYQRQGLYKEMNRLRLSFAAHQRTSIIYTQTQNPQVEQGILSILDEMKTNRDISSFSFQRIHIPKAYGRMLTKEIPVARNLQYDVLNYAEGDAYVLVFSLSYL